MNLMIYGKGTALKPAHEPIVMARKPLSEKTVAENVLKWGTGGINIDESRIGILSEKDRESMKVGFKYENNVQYNTYGKTKFPEGYDFNNNLPQGRFPANLIHDGSEEVLREFEKAGVSKSFPHLHNHNKTPSNIFEEGTITKGEYFSEHNDSGTPARFFKTCEFSEEDYPPFFYTAKASKSERNEGCDYLDEHINSNGDKCSDIDRRDGKIPVIKNNHPTVKPVKLMEYLIKLVTPKDGIVLELFAGSGTTLVACKKLGYQFIGIEKEAEYVKIIEARLSAIKDTQKQLDIEALQKQSEELK